MPSKKREKESEVVKFLGREQQLLHTDHEIFLQAFEKPTQIYRYLRTRNQISPIFLQRTLSYMGQKMSRSHKKRSELKVDAVAEKLKESLEKKKGLGNYMTLIFAGFFERNFLDRFACDKTVRVEVVLLKIEYKKRKESSSPYTQDTLGASEVPVNPTDTDVKLPAISIPFDLFKPVGHPMNRSAVLLVTVEIMPKINNIIVIDDEDEQARKQAKRCTTKFGAQLVIFDKHNRCLLTDGEYELELQEIVSTAKNGSPKKHTTWEFIADESCLHLIDCFQNPFEEFAKRPKLKFYIKWTSEPCNGTFDRPKPFKQIPETESIVTNGDEAIDMINGKDSSPMPGDFNHNNNSIAIRSSGHLNGMTRIKTEAHFPVVYQFNYNSNSRQKTDDCGDMICPWCSLNCTMLYSLLKHLKLCHARFTFTYVPLSNGARIDVSINDMYDGSYAGSPHDLVGPAGCAFARAGPVRRTVVTHLLVCRPRRQKPSLTEFLELDENELQNQRPYITGHNRLYHHTETCLPVHPKELDIDSEGESDPLWLQHKTMQMIDEFTDVNEGEKELMKMWNLHVMKHGFVGNCQLPIACDMFLDIRGKEILQKNLYSNFVLHFCSLFDYGLISAEVVYKSIQKLQSMLSTYQEGRKSITESREAQLDYWLKCGKEKQALQEEKQKQQQLIKQNEPSTSTGRTTIGSTNSAKALQSKLLKSTELKKSLVTFDKDHTKVVGERTKDTKVLCAENAAHRRRTVNLSTVSSKRRISPSRDSTLSRRSATTIADVRTPLKRRKSMAITSASNPSGSSSSKSNQIGIRNRRISVTVIKFEKN